MVAKLNQFVEYELCYGNRFYVKNHGHSAVFGGNSIGYNIRSTGFTVSGISGTVYLGDKPNSSLEKGKLFLFKLNSPSEPIIVKQNVGTIDYITGEIRLNPINIISTIINRDSPLVEISAQPYSNDVIGLQDLYLQLDVNNTTVNVIVDNISSGNDISGTNYVVSSSYGSDRLVRGIPVTTVDVGVISETSTIASSVRQAQSAGRTPIATTSRASTVSRSTSSGRSSY